MWGGVGVFPLPSFALVKTPTLTAGFASVDPQGPSSSVPSQDQPRATSNAGACGMCRG